MTSDERASGLDNQLCFSLYSASRAVTAVYRQGLADLGLTYTQYVVMLLLWEHDRLPMSQLCERLHLDSATLSPLLKRLEGQGLVIRSRTVEDERVVVVTCTPAGRALAEPVRAIQAEVAEATGMSEDELDRLRVELDELSARLRGWTAIAPTALA